MPPGIGSGSETSPTESPKTKGLTNDGRSDNFCQSIFPPIFLVGATD